MKSWTKVWPVVLAAAALLLAMPFAASAADQAKTQTMAKDQIHSVYGTTRAADQTRTQTMAQDQMHSVNGTASANAGQYQESHMWAEQTANMGDTTQVKAGEAKKEAEKRGEGLGSDGSDKSEPSATRTGADGSGGNNSGSKK